MNWARVFEFVHPDWPEAVLRLSSLLPPRKWGAVVALSAVLPVLLLSFKASLSSPRQRGLVLLAASLVLLGVYTFTAGYIDEVFINLEHPYNLLHHGLFSFSPQARVDGTVEIVYYLLLVPFAFSREWLVRGHFILGFALAWAHIYLLWKMLSKMNAHPLGMAGALLFGSLFVPFVKLFSHGFGAGLLSLCLALCLYFDFEGKRERALLTAALMPLLRPDAVLYSAAVFFVDFLKTKRPAWRHLGIAAACVATYAVSVRLYYGHWTPTPALFKSFTWGMGPMIVWDEVRAKWTSWVLSPFHYFFFISLVLSFFLPSDRRIKDLRLYTLPLGALFMFYSTVYMLDYLSPGNHRYTAGLETFALFFPTLFFQEVTNRTNGAAMMQKELMYTATKIMTVATYAFTLCNVYMIERSVPRLISRVDHLGAAGQIVDRLVPREWAIATTELNSFSFMNDRQVIDLFGYTNRDIVTFPLFNEMRMRNNPDLFLRLKPDVFWWYFPGSQPKEKLLDPGHLVAFNLGKSYNQLGDMKRVMQLYDVFYLRQAGHGLALFVRRDRSDAFIDLLRQKHYSLVSSGAVDGERLSGLYDAQKLVQYPLPQVRKEVSP